MKTEAEGAAAHRPGEATWGERGTGIVVAPGVAVGAGIWIFLRMKGAHAARRKSCAAASHEVLRWELLEDLFGTEEPDTRLHRRFPAATAAHAMMGEDMDPGAVRRLVRVGAQTRGTLRRHPVRRAAPWSASCYACAHVCCLHPV